MDSRLLAALESQLTLPWTDSTKSFLTMYAARVKIIPERRKTPFGFNFSGFAYFEIPTLKVLL